LGKEVERPMVKLEVRETLSVKPFQTAGKRGSTLPSRPRFRAISGVTFCNSLPPEKCP
jgi:hypothetical protein